MCVHLKFKLLISEKVKKQSVYHVESEKLLVAIELAMQMILKKKRGCSRPTL
jgi:hypothetical protein